MAIEYLSKMNDDGSSINQTAAQKCGEHGKVSAQIANISIISAGITVDGITALVDAQNVAINAMIAGLTVKGTVADV
jgi:hypothetical protein